MTAMHDEVLLLMLTAGSIGLFHTVLGPDHYLPFIVMARAGRWSMVKTAWVTVLCGVGHVLSSVVLGLIGVALGIAVTRLEAVESFRGNLAAWALVAFGFTYFVWGMHRALKHRPHRHPHAHGDQTQHTHTHAHTEEHVHVHTREAPANLTPWILFTVFIFGPCEPLIPILMYPAAKNSLWGLILVTAVFATATIGTMLAVVLVSSFAVVRLPTARLERYSHALAGAVICSCGLAIQFLGL